MQRTVNRVQLHTYKLQDKLDIFIVVPNGYEFC